MLVGILYVMCMEKIGKRDTAKTKYERTSAQTETQRVYEALKRAILAGELRQGEPLQEVRLSKELQTSRTPIREALVKLEADGLLTIAPRKGAFVLQLSLRDFLEINELRVILEPAAARSGAVSIDDSEVVSLQAKLRSIAAEAPSDADYQALQELDRCMHTAIAKASRNARMAQIIENLNGMMEFIRQRDMRRRHRDMYDSIENVLSALAQHDADAAEAALRDHIVSFSKALTQLI